MQTAPNIVHGDWKTYQHEAARVRAMVFIAEQKVPRELEFDEDDKTAEHFISFDARHMVTGCARLLDNGRIATVYRREEYPRAANELEELFHRHYLTRLSDKPS